MHFAIKATHVPAVGNAYTVIHLRPCTQLANVSYVTHVQLVQKGPVKGTIGHSPMELLACG